jgi:uncharacterized protein YybS (DUF2232 family)
MRKLRPTVEGAFLAALTVVLYLSSVYLPLFGFFLSFFCPLPVLFLVVRWDLRTGTLAAGVATLLVAFTGLIPALICISYTLIGIFLGYAIKRKYSFFEVIGFGSLVSLLSKIALIGFALLITGINPIVENLQIMEEAFQRTSQVFGGIGEENFQQIVTLINLALPAILVVASILDTTINFFLGSWVGKKIGIPFPEYPAFRNWKFPVSVFWMFILSWMFVLFGGETIYGRIGLNLQIVTQSLFIVQGVAIVYYFLSRYIQSRGVKIIILLFVVFQPIFSTILSWLGVLDTWFDFRKMSSPKG